MEDSGAASPPAQRRVIDLPPGQTVDDWASFDDGFFARVDQQLTAGACRHGRLEIEVDDLRLLGLVRDSEPFLAGMVEESSWTRLPLRELPVRARQLDNARCRLLATDEILTRMVAVHLCQAPALRSSTRLVDPERVLLSIAEEGRDAVLAFERDGGRTLLSIAAGRPERLYFADPSLDPGVEEGDLSDRLLAMIFRPHARPGVLEVFSHLEVLGDADAGVELADLAAVDRPPPPTTVGVSLGRGREVLNRPFTPPEVVIGRDPRCEIFLDNLAVSRRHARIVWSRGRFLLEDLDSANGTRVNGTKVRSVPLGPADRIEIGKFRIQLEARRPQPGMSDTMLLSAPALGLSKWALKGDDQEAPLDRGTVIGRGQGVDLVARGWAVRAVHARVEPSVGEVELVCFGRATARLNGHRVRRARLSIGDKVGIGRTEFEVVRR